MLGHFPYGTLNAMAKKFAQKLCQCAIKPEIDVMFMGFTEAEAVNLFSNTYLAKRVSFFNRLDTYAQVRGLDIRSIIVNRWEKEQEDAVEKVYTRDLFIRDLKRRCKETWKQIQGIHAVSQKKASPVWA